MSRLLLGSSLLLRSRLLGSGLLCSLGLGSGLLGSGLLCSLGLGGRGIGSRGRSGGRGGLLCGGLLSGGLLRALGGLLCGGLLCGGLLLGGSLGLGGRWRRFSRGGGRGSRGLLNREE